MCREALPTARGRGIALIACTGLLLFHGVASTNSAPKFPHSSTVNGTFDSKLPRQNSEEKGESKSAFQTFTAMLFGRDGQLGMSGNSTVPGNSTVGRGNVTWHNATSSGGNATMQGENVVVKSRLRPFDIFKKGKEKGHERFQKVKDGKHSKGNLTIPTVTRSKILDIVIVHFDHHRTDEMVDYWLNFLQLKKVQELKPYVYIYCQNEEYDLTEDHFGPILQLGGEVIHTSNIGRESHAYLQHILDFYSDLPEHVLFAQDLSSSKLPKRFEIMFEKKSGFLPLSFVGHVECEDPWLPKGWIPQIYAMFAKELCPPMGFTASFEGQFIVSRQRIKNHAWWVYRKLQDFLVADRDHWIHDSHNNDHYKDKANPFFGHVLERSWSVAFSCFESWREGNCQRCEHQLGFRDCGDGACQCYD